MTLQHSQGPWRWNEGTLEAANGEAVLWPTNAVSPEAGESLLWSQILGACGEETELLAAGNAKVIETAPELLAALKAVVALSDRNQTAWNNARAVIAKAEGRS